MTPLLPTPQSSRSVTSAYGEDISVVMSSVNAIDFAAGNLDSDINQATFGSGSIENVAGHVVLQTGTSIDSFASIMGTRLCPYKAGQVTVYRIGAVVGTGGVGFESAFGVGDNNDGMFFGYDGEDFSVIVRSTGFVPMILHQDSWNIINSPAFFNPVMINAFQIRSAACGAGAVEFSIQDPDSDEFILVHRHITAGQSSLRALSLPIQPFAAAVANTSSNDSHVMSIAEMSSFIEGTFNIQGQNYNFETAPIAMDDPEIPIVAFRINPTFNSRSNKGSWLPRRLHAFNEGSKPIILRFYLNPSITGGSFSDINTGQSFTSVNDSMTGFSSGKPILTVVVDAGVDLFGAALGGVEPILAGQELLITGQRPGGASEEVVLELLWLETF